MFNVFPFENTINVMFLSGSEMQEMFDFIEKSMFDRLGVFTYSHEEQTHSHTLVDDVSETLKQERMEMIMELQQEISLELNQKKIGKIFFLWRPRTRAPGKPVRKRCVLPWRPASCRRRRRTDPPQPPADERCRVHPQRQQPQQIGRAHV